MMTPRSQGATPRLCALLDEACGDGKLSRALVCTADGQLIASSDASSTDTPSRLAALTSLFTDVASRAGKDLSMQAIDEVTLLDEHRGRVVIRPLGVNTRGPMFLVVELPRPSSWRRTTTLLQIKITQILIRRRAADS